MTITETQIVNFYKLVQNFAKDFPQLFKILEHMDKKGVHYDKVFSQDRNQLSTFEEKLKKLDNDEIWHLVHGHWNSCYCQTAYSKFLDCEVEFTDWIYKLGKGHFATDYREED